MRPDDAGSHRLPQMMMSFNCSCRTLLPDFCLLKSRRIESSRVGPSATHCAYDGGLVKPSRHVAISLHSNGITVYRRHAQVSDRPDIESGHYAPCTLKSDDAYVSNPLPCRRGADTTYPPDQISASHTHLHAAEARLLRPAPTCQVRHTPPAALLLPRCTPRGSGVTL
jgi:hypothetical protein